MRKHSLNITICGLLFSTLFLSCTKERQYLHTVTVEEFSAFVKETAYVTDAEKYGWSFIQQDVSNYQVVENVNWKIPDGEQKALDEMPVTQVSYNDAIAYCEWFGCDLPTYEQYWELADLDTRTIIQNSDKIIRSDLVNVVGNVWDITKIDAQERVRLAGGSLFCSVNSCNGTSKKRELYVDRETGNIHVSFSIIKQFDE